MAKGVIYVMNTCVDGLVKIGKTRTDRFENRMAFLEKNGYRRIGVLTRTFAIEVEDYSEKEKLIHEIFSKSRVGDTELFSIDVNLVMQLMASMDGRIIYPEEENKIQIFEQATEVIQSRQGVIPDGIYKLKVKNTKTKGYLTAEMQMKAGVITVKKGAKLGDVTTISSKALRKKREDLRIENNTLMEDFECEAPSPAATIILGHNTNGWQVWKNVNGEVIDVYRKQEAEESGEIEE